MLVLSRKESQRIKLGDSIVVTVIRVTGDKVRLGIEAPADVLVLRGELDTRTTGTGQVEASLSELGEVELERAEANIVEKVASV